MILEGKTVIVTGVGPGLGPEWTGVGGQDAGESEDVVHRRSPSWRGITAIVAPVRPTRLDGTFAPTPRIARRRR